MTQDAVSLKLSPREKQVLQLVAEGLVCKQIAHRLSICETTVITYKNRLKKSWRPRIATSLYTEALR